VSGAIIELELTATAAGGAPWVVSRREGEGEMRAVKWGCARVTNHTCSRGGTPGICWSATRSALFGASDTLELRRLLSTVVVKRAIQKSNNAWSTRHLLMHSCAAWGYCAREPDRSRRRLRSSTAWGLNGRMLACPLKVRLQPPCSFRDGLDRTVQLRQFVNPRSTSWRR
jgi:hypothetical protein